MERARLRLAEGRVEEGLNDWKTVMVLARRLGSDTVLVMKLCGVGLESVAVSKIAPFIPQLPEDDLKKLDQIIQSLPEKGSGLAATVDREMSLAWGWYEKMLLKGDAEISTLLESSPCGPMSKQEFLEMVASLRRDIAASQAWLKLPYPLAVEGFGKATFSPFGKDFFSIIMEAAKGIAKADCEVAMLQTAIALQLRQPDALARHLDPLSGEPFVMKRRESGFTLVSKAKMDGKPVMVPFGGTVK